MKVYGFTETDVRHGEIGAYEIPAGVNLLDAMDALGVECQWEEAHIDFRCAQRRLVALMRAEEDVDPDLLRGVRGMRAGDVPVQFLDGAADRSPPPQFRPDEPSPGHAA